MSEKRSSIVRTFAAASASVAAIAIFVGGIIYAKGRIGIEESYSDSGSDFVQAGSALAESAAQVNLLPPEGLSLSRPNDLSPLSSRIVNAFEKACGNAGSRRRECLDAASQELILQGKTDMFRKTAAVENLNRSCVLGTGVASLIGVGCVVLGMSIASRKSVRPS